MSRMRRRLSRTSALVYMSFGSDRNFHGDIVTRNSPQIVATHEDEVESLTCDEGVDGVGRGDQSGQARPDNDDVSVHGANAID